MPSIATAESAGGMAASRKCRASPIERDQLTAQHRPHNGANAADAQPPTDA